MVNKFNYWFNIYNKKLFNNELPIIDIKKSHGKKRLGCYRYISGEYKPGSITISTAYNLDDNKFKEILIHEMIHAYIHYKGIDDNSAHGKEYISIMDRINDKLKDEKITITIKIKNLDNYEIKNKVSYPFMLIDNKLLMRIAKSKEEEYKRVFSKDKGIKFFHSDSDILNSLKKSISKQNLYKLDKGNELYNELIKEGIL